MTDHVPFFFCSITHEDMKGLKKGKKMEKVLRQGLRDWILVTAREQIFSEEMFAFPPSRVFLYFRARLPALCW